MADARRVVIPYAPRPQFMPLHDRKQRWGVGVCHRRAGKTVSCINDLIRAAITCPLNEPRFAYIAPFYAQAKDVAWSYLKRFTAPIPGAIPHESELRVDLPNGGRVRLYGADNYDRLRGTYFDGVVMDEYGDMDPRAWSEVLRPALSDRRGWGLFIGTPKGRNHFARLWDQAKHDDEWFTLMLRASESGLLPDEELRDARKTMTPDQYEQEYECSFQAAVIGAYYGALMQDAEKDNRIGKVPHDPSLPVYTAWDLGIGDSTAIVCAQLAGMEIRIIDFIESNGVGLDWYVRELDRRPYRYAEHMLPHDAQVRELGTGRSRIETLGSLGVHQTRVLPRTPIDDRINAARLIIPRCWFSQEKSARLVECLQNYRAERDEKRDVLKDHPLHDWTSHGADAFGYLAQGLPSAGSSWSKPIRYDNRGIV